MQLRLSSVNMLYIDVEPSNRAVVKDMLAVAGVEMIEAQSTEEGLASFGDGQIHLVLADLRLVGLDGIAALRDLCVTACERTAPIFAMAPEVSPASYAACVKAGAADLIVKPVAMDALIAIATCTRPADGRA